MTFPYLPVNYLFTPFYHSTNFKSTKISWKMMEGEYSPLISTLTFSFHDWISGALQTEAVKSKFCFKSRNIFKYTCIKSQSSTTWTSVSSANLQEQCNLIWTHSSETDFQMPLQVRTGKVLAALSRHCSQQHTSLYFEGELKRGNTNNWQGYQSCPEVLWITEWTGKSWVPDPIT